jgi:hypothetical protein
MSLLEGDHKSLFTGLNFLICEYISWTIPTSLITMKVFILLAVVALASAGTLNSAANERLNAAFKSGLHAFMTGGERADLIPALNQTMPINDTRIDFANQTLIVGFVELIDAVAYDLHTLVDDIDFNLLTLKASGLVTLEKASIVGFFGTELIIHLPFIEPPFTNETVASGAGAGDLGAELVEISFSAKLVPNFITDRVHITNLSADVKIGGLRLYLENLVVDGVLVNWEEVNLVALEWFNHLVATQKPTLEAAILEIVNFILKDIKLSDIIGLIGK